MSSRILFACLVPLLLVACKATRAPSAAPPVVAKNRVVVLGMIHGGHRTSPDYSIARLVVALQRIEPDYVLCEIPPDRLGSALEGFQSTGTVSEARVSRFPEYVDALFPLTREMDFEIVPCAAWTQAMSDSRAALLSEWKSTRAAESDEVDAVQELADAQLAEASARAGLALDDPLFIHTARYDQLTKQGLEAYDRLFNEDLGAGGWTHINAAHYALIAAALDAHSGEGATVLITFGAGHKYWILAQLSLREDIELVDARTYFAP